MRLLDRFIDGLGVGLGLLAAGFLLGVLRFSHEPDPAEEEDLPTEGADENTEEGTCPPPKIVFFDRQAI